MERNHLFRVSVSSRRWLLARGQDSDANGRNAFETKVSWNWEVQGEESRFRGAWLKGSNSISRSQPFSVSWPCSLSGGFISSHSDCFLSQDNQQLSWLCHFDLAGFKFYINGVIQYTFNIYFFFFYLHYIVGVIYFVIHVCSSFIFNAICQLYNLFLLLYMNLFPLSSYY